MTETKILTDEELKQITGGADAPDGRRPKFQQGDVVERLGGWILEILDIINWCDEEAGFTYQAKILEIERPSGRFYVGAKIYVTEHILTFIRHGI